MCLFVVVVVVVVVFNLCLLFSAYAASMAKLLRINMWLLFVCLFVSGLPLKSHLLNYPLFFSFFLFLSLFFVCVSLSFFFVFFPSIIPSLSSSMDLYIYTGMYRSMVVA